MAGLSTFAAASAAGATEFSAALETGLAMTSVVVVVAHGVYRDALAAALTAAGLTVVGVAAAGQSAKRVIEASAPDVAIVDLPAPEGIALARWCRRTTPHARVLTLSLAETEAEVFSWAAAGLAGYVCSGGSLDDLVRVVERVVTGEAAYSSGAVELLVKHASAPRSSDSHGPPPIRLTAREHEVVELIAHGLSNKEIAGRLSIEVATVKNHVHHILEKLDVHRRTEAAARLRGEPDVELHASAN
jgi:two-component system, NarL family, nitrate/nitrite response regulator NarL